MSPNPRKSSNSFTGNYAKIYGLIIKSVEKTADSALLAELYKSVNNSGQSSALPLDDNVEVVRMFTRLGIILATDNSVIAKEKITDTIACISQEADRSEAIVSVLIRLFAAGQYGIVSRPVCGSSPQCSKCQLTKFCNFYNSPPIESSDSKIPLYKRLKLNSYNKISDSELLALILGGERPAGQHIKIAENFISRFGSLRNMANSNISEFESLRNVSKSSAAKIFSAVLLYQRIAREDNLKKHIIKESSDLFNLFNLKLRDEKQEHFYIVILDNMNGIISQEQIALGGLSSVHVEAREVFAPALKKSAAAVAFIHNHPSGNPKASRDDILLTHRLVQAGEILGIRVVDHIIIGDNKYTSFLNDCLGPFRKNKKNRI